jgi:hypothetical protein
MTLYFLARALLVYGFSTSIGDAFSTYFAIRNGAHEANWGWAWVMKTIGPKWVIPRIMFAQGVVWVNVTFGHYDWISVGTLSITAAFMSWVVWHNLRLAGWWGNP